MWFKTTFIRRCGKNSRKENLFHNKRLNAPVRILFVPNCLFHIPSLSAKFFLYPFYSSLFYWVFFSFTRKASKSKVRCHHLRRARVSAFSSAVGVVSAAASGVVFSGLSVTGDGGGGSGGGGGAGHRGAIFGGARGGRLGMK